ncbi:FKBP-type peptidyl-prolyl cis-trans isomerase [Hymenobacter latericus]|uniref:FKBP-type peptidyl-prolyl cis-trans isomerase n=1 Tax=Hymenobacter sp. YIM 151858-1 TaxID=2987688 RepID=UPI0022262B06|nr:FKBP-type peptidyl-prolyl cis-trans isomerase [Hymenobacter sp. YIM 151858-1]UYZ57714.1 FKBP-type peptidyl-prolyl cis-trans isomerase [Hymenobacter sp. YIM 151858-1]
MRTASTSIFARLALWALLPLLLALGACDNKTDFQKDIEKKIEAQKPIDDATIQDYLKKNNITDYTRTNSGLYIVWRKKIGSGVRPVRGKEVRARYIGRFISNGLRFDSSIDNGSPDGATNFVVGQVIEGWNEALTEHMYKGEDVLLLIPSHLAYGYTGNLPSIQPYTPIMFELELLDVKQ